MSFLLPKTSTFNDVAEHMAKMVKIQPGGSGKLRIFDIIPSGRAQREYTGSEMIGNLQDPAELWAEVSGFPYLSFGTCDNRSPR